MSGSTIWKLVISSFVLAWAIANLIPMRDTPFPDYVRGAAETQREEFFGLLQKAEERVESGESPTLFLALREAANEDEIDLAQFFPEIRLEAAVRNIARRNEIVMNELLRRSRGQIQLGLDLRGGVAFTLQVQERERPEEVREMREDQLAQAIRIIRSRADGLGVAEPVIRPVGDNRIEVQLPGLTTRDNPDVANELQKPARLEFRLVHRELRPQQVSVDQYPSGYEVLALERETEAGDIVEEPYFVRRIPEMTGDAVDRAFPSVDEFGRYRVALRFTPEGSDRFADVTRRIAEENRRTGSIGQLAIVLDGTLFSAPTVREEIRGGNAEITGRFSRREATELSNVLNNPLDLPLEIAEMHEVGPSLAEDSIIAGVRAGVIGGILVLLFMLGYYMVAGAVACFTLAFNITLVLGVLASVGATLTLPGIAGIILTIGMAVDANVLIFERIREELKMGKSLRAALQGGYEKVFSTIVDANVTTLLTAGILIWLGTGPVKGFGVTLAIGIFASMFGALVVSRFFLELLVHSGWIKKLSMFSVIGESNIDFLQYRKHAFFASWVIVLIGVSTVAVKQSDVYGIDFVGGDELSIRFEERLATSDIENVAADNQLGEVIPVYQRPLGEEREVLRLQTEFGRAGEVFRALEEAFPQAGLTVESETRIGPAVGREIRWNAFLSVGIALIGILLYVALRFEMGYGVGAVVATVHDLLMTIGIFVLSGRQFNAPMVAAILMVVGYSLNDTIVLFDRIREQLGLDQNSSLKKIVNEAINRVLARTIITSLTTLLAAGSLYVFGGGVINDFAFTFIIGILTGTFSSIFIASPVFYWWHKGDRKHVEERRDILPKYEWEASTRASRRGTTPPAEQTSPSS